MVWVKNVAMKAVFVCDVCNFGYADAKTALACEDFCKKNKACSADITKKAVYRP